MARTADSRSPYQGAVSRVLGFGLLAAGVVAAAQLLLSGSGELAAPGIAAVSSMATAAICSVLTAAARSTWPRRCVSGDHRSAHGPAQPARISGTRGAGAGTGGTQRRAADPSRGSGRPQADQRPPRAPRGGHGAGARRRGAAPRPPNRGRGGAPGRRRVLGRHAGHGAVRGALRGRADPGPDRTGLRGHRGDADGKHRHCRVPARRQKTWRSCSMPPTARCTRRRGSGRTDARSSTARLRRATEASPLVWSALFTGN